MHSPCSPLVFDPLILPIALYDVSDFYPIKLAVDKALTSRAVWRFFIQNWQEQVFSVDDLGYFPEQQLPNYKEPPTKAHAMGCSNSLWASLLCHTMDVSFPNSSEFLAHNSELSSTMVNLLIT